MMGLPRLQLFEFNDSAWAPKLLRDTIIEALSRSLEAGRVLEGVVEPFATFLEASGTTEVLDLCAGAGAPAAILATELGPRSPKFLLTDLFPHVGEWERLKASHPDVIDFVPGAVDATAVEPQLGLNRTRVIINALHHFAPALAQQILMASCQPGSRGVFVVEGLIRNPLRFAAFARTGIPALLRAPFTSSDRRLGRALVIPAALLASLWDGSVSAMRCYSEAELRAFVAPLGEAWRWEFGGFSYEGFGRGTWFYGVPRSPAEAL